MVELMMNLYTAQINHTSCMHLSVYLSEASTFSRFQRDSGNLNNSEPGVIRLLNVIHKVLPDRQRSSKKHRSGQL